MTVVKTKEFTVFQTDNFKVIVTEHGKPDELQLITKGRTEHARTRHVKAVMTPAIAAEMIELMQAYLKEVY